MSGGSVELMVEKPGRRELEFDSALSRAHGRHAATGKRLRQLFFALSAVGGFVIGSATLAVVLQARGRAVGLEDPLVLEGLAVGAVASAACGLIAAAAYREMRNRRR